jgi:hypothetical protein
VVLCAWCEGRFFPLVVCLTTGPKPLPQRAIHIVRRKILDDLNGRRGYSHLKEEALDRTDYGG